MESYEILWKDALIDLQSSEISQQGYTTFIEPLVAADLKGNKLVLWSKTNLAAERVNKSYADIINESL